MLMIADSIEWNTITSYVVVSFCIGTWANLPVLIKRRVEESQVENDLFKLENQMFLHGLLQALVVFPLIVASLHQIRHLHMI